MSGTKKEHVKIILQTIENGTLSEAETEQRLLGLVRQEAERKDRPADLGLIGRAWNWLISCKVAVVTWIPRGLTS